MAIQPSVDPLWATDANYPAGGAPWSATPTRVAPSSGKIAEGMEPDELFFAQWFNYGLGTNGDWVNALRRGGTTEFSIRDDFAGGPDSQWTLSGGGAGITNITDNAADGFGAEQFAADGTNTGPNISRCLVPLGTRDFYILSRSRASVDNAGSTAQITFSDGTNFASWSGVGGGNWFAVYGSGPTTFDSGVAVDATYRYFEIERRSGHIYFRIDGAAVTDAALATSFGNTNLVVGATRSSGAGLTHQCDLINLWVKR